MCGDRAQHTSRSGADQPNVSSHSAASAWPPSDNDRMTTEIIATAHSVTPADHGSSTTLASALDHLVEEREDARVTRASGRHSFEMFVAV
jgi:hypothetical protein